MPKIGSRVFDEGGLMGTDVSYLELINERLKSLLLKHLPRAGMLKVPGIDSLTLIRREEENNEGQSLLVPSLGFVVQGQKRTFIGGKEYAYGKYHCVAVGVDVPTSFCAVRATHAEPFLVVSLALDRFLLSELIAQMPAVESSDNSDSAFNVGLVDEEVLGAVMRLVQLLEHPEQVPVLAPMLIREIHYRVLMTELGVSLRRFNAKTGASSQMSKAIAWLRENYRRPLSVPELADVVHMGVSTFHRHFKEVTNMTPLQFHKQLRLHEAKRLMIAEQLDATSACYAVGYESPSQFNREYKRQFGEPPYRDIKRRKDREVDAEAVHQSGETFS